MSLPFTSRCQNGSHFIKKYTHTFISVFFNYLSRFVLLSNKCFRLLKILEFTAFCKNEENYELINDYVIMAMGVSCVLLFHSQDQLNVLFFEPIPL